MSDHGPVFIAVKPCPCCGSMKMETRGSKLCSIACTHCGLRTPGCASHEVAAQVWNHRHRPSRPAGIVIKAGPALYFLPGLLVIRQALQEARSRPGGELAADLIANHIGIGVREDGDEVHKWWSHNLELNERNTEFVQGIMSHISKVTEEAKKGQGDG